MRFVTFVCILGQILLSQHAARSVCECIEDVTEGEIIVAGDEIMFDGVAEIEGNVPMSGKIAFEGPVRAAGTVTIIGTSRPVFPAFGLSPTIAPSMMFPTYYYPYYSFPNAYYAAPDSDEALGYGNIKANGEEIHVVGETSIEGNVPITGNVCFGGGVPAFGKVKILARF